MVGSGQVIADKARVALPEVTASYRELRADNVIQKAAMLGLIRSIFPCVHVLIVHGVLALEELKSSGRTDALILACLCFASEKFLS